MECPTSVASASSGAADHTCRLPRHHSEGRASARGHKRSKAMAMRSTLAMGRSMMPVRPPTVTRLQDSRLLSAATDMAATRPSLAGERRCAETEEGSKQCRRLRQSGWVPGIIYGAGQRDELVKVGAVICATPRHATRANEAPTPRNFVRRTLRLTPPPHPSPSYSRAR